MQHQIYEHNGITIRCPKCGNRWISVDEDKGTCDCGFEWLITYEEYEDTEEE